MADQDRSRIPGEFEDKQSQALVRAMFGTCQHLMAVINFNRRRTRRGRGELLTDVCKRLEATSLLIDEWLEANRP
jgi:hypothetical protein